MSKKATPVKGRRRKAVDSGAKIIAKDQKMQQQPKPKPPAQQQPQPQPQNDPDYHDAIKYVEAVEGVLSTNKYWEFLEILKRFQSTEVGDVKKVVEEFCILFADHHDFLFDFSMFLPPTMKEEGTRLLTLAITQDSNQVVEAVGRRTRRQKRKNHS